jgi:hypothetical protein
MATAVALAPTPIQQFFNNAGQPNVGGSLLTQVGGVNTATYQDAAGSIALPNPIPLNSRGEVSNAAGTSCQLFLQNNVTYTFTLYDAAGNQLNQATSINPSAALAVLGGATGATLVGYTPPGTGAVATTVGAALPDLAGAVRLIGFSGGTWLMFDENGSPHSTAGTTTNGLQEAINYSISVGRTLEVYAAGTIAGGTLPLFINCATGINVPPNQQWSAFFRGVNITFANSVNGPGITFDSMEGSAWVMDSCVVVYQPASPAANSWAAYCNPQNPTPGDHITTITGSKIHISDIATPATGLIQGVWGFNCSGGSINTSTFSSYELNGTGTGSTPNSTYGIVIFGQTAISGFEQNIVDITNFHLYASAGIQIGTNSTNAVNLRQNIWRIGALLGGAASQGVNTFGSYDDFTIGGITNEQGAFTSGIICESSAVKNKFRVGQILSPAGAPIVNAFPANGNRFECDNVPPALVTILAGGSGTFFPQPWTRSIQVEMVGGGAGGDGSGTGATNGAAGNATTFGTLTANGGARGAGAGGTASGGDVNIQGGGATGSFPAITGVSVSGGIGGGSFFSGGGGVAANAVGGSAPTLSGAGGGGGGAAAATAGGAGGSAGAYCRKHFTSLLTSYAWVAGGAAAGGAGGTSGNGGGQGAAGQIIVTEFP